MTNLAETTANQQNGPPRLMSQRAFGLMSYWLLIAMNVMPSFYMITPTPMRLPPLLPIA